MNINNGVGIYPVNTRETKEESHFMLSSGFLPGLVYLGDIPASWIKQNMEEQRFQRSYPTKVPAAEIRHIQLYDQPYRLICSVN